MKRLSLVQVVRHSRLFVAYFLLVGATIVVFVYMQQITDQVELESLARTYENCKANNDIKELIATILDRIAEQEDSTLRNETSRGLRLRDDLNELLQSNECPPPPQF